MKIGIPVAIIGVLGIIIGGAMYAAKYHRTVGIGGLILGVILLVVGAIYWTMVERKATTSKTPAAGQQQPVQPSPTTP